MVCIRCQKRPAIIFIQRMDNGQMKQEGYCLHCARELHIKPVDDLMKQFGMSDQDLDNMENRMESMMEEMGDANPLSMMMNMANGGEDADPDSMDEDLIPGSNATFPLGFTSSEKKDGDKKADRKNGKKPPKRKFLDTYCENLTRKAREGKLDDIIGRDREIYRTIQILSRRQKNNPCLIGEAGVGKTAIAEGIAERIAKGNVPIGLKDKEIYLLDLTSLVAGTQFRGQFEQRVKGLLSEVKAAGNVILFIDEIHTIIGAGGAEGALDASNILKPSLARGEIQLIGATTIEEYRKYIEKDAALERRFQPVSVEEPSKEQCLEILKGLKGRYESHHKVLIRDEALEAAVSMSERYITDRNLPDKAIDVLDESCSKVSLKGYKVPENLTALDLRLKELEKQKEESIKNGCFEEASLLQKEQEEAEKKSEQLKKRFQKKTSSSQPEVTEEDIAEVVSSWTKIPVQKLAESDTDRLKKLESVLHQRVIGQEEAVKAVARAVKRGRVGLKDPNKPIGTFMFLGPTGVGKTHLAKKLAEYLFDSADSLIRIDMSEYLEKFAVSRLIGAPPGYVGYEEGGQLTEKVRRKPYSVVLLDEIEKAHPDVFNLLLQVLDEGRLTDSLGRRIDFKNTILIMTSNIGTRQLKDFGRGVGFSSQAAGEMDKDFSRGVIQKALNKAFAPEFLNRVDDIIMFDQLDKDAIHKIIDIELQGLYKRVCGLGYELVLTDEAKDFIATKGYDVQFGARPLKRAIQKYLEDEMAELIIRASVGEGDKIVVDFNKDEQKIVTSVQKKGQE